MLRTHEAFFFIFDIVVQACRIQPKGWALGEQKRASFSLLTRPPLRSSSFHPSHKVTEWHDEGQGSVSYEKFTLSFFPEQELRLV